MRTITKYLEINFNLVFFILCILLAGCQDISFISGSNSEDLQSTPEENSFTATIDGKDWETNDIYFDLSGDNLIITGQIERNEEHYAPYQEFLSLRIGTFSGIGTYNLGSGVHANGYDDGNLAGHYLYERDSKGDYIRNERYQTDNEHTGTVVISKFDEDNGIISGTFEFTAKEDFGTNIRVVKDGNFHINYFEYLEEN